MVSALRNINGSSSARKILGTPWNGLLAEQIAAETASGDHGPGALYNEAIKVEHAGLRLSMHVTSKPGVGYLRVEENGDVFASGFPNGVYVVPYDFNVGGEYQGSSDFTLTFGVVGNALVTGGTGTSTGSGVGGNATGQLSGTVTGGTGTSVGSGTGGDAAGQAGGDALVTGGTGTSTGSGTGGDATGQVGGDALVTGGTGTSVGSGTGGDAAGQADGVVTGSTGTSTGSGTGGNPRTGAPDGMSIKIADSYVSPVIPYVKLAAQYVAVDYVFVKHGGSYLPM